MWAKLGQMVITTVVTLLMEKIPGWIKLGVDYVKRKAARKKEDATNQTAAERSANASTVDEAREAGNDLP